MDKLIEERKEALAPSTSTEVQVMPVPQKNIATTNSISEAVVTPPPQMVSGTKTPRKRVPLPKEPDDFDLPSPPRNRRIPLSSAKVLLADGTQFDLNLLLSQFRNIGTTQRAVEPDVEKDKYYRLNGKVLVVPPSQMPKPRPREEMRKKFVPTRAAKTDKLVTASKFAYLPKAQTQEPKVSACDSGDQNRFAALSSPDPDKDPTNFDPETKKEKATKNVAQLDKTIVRPKPPKFIPKTARQMHAEKPWSYRDSHQAKNPSEYWRSVEERDPSFESDVRRVGGAACAEVYDSVSESIYEHQDPDDKPSDHKNNRGIFSRTDAPKVGYKKEKPPPRATIRPSGPILPLPPPLPPGPPPPRPPRPPIPRPPLPRALPAAIAHPAAPAAPVAIPVAVLPVLAAAIAPVLPVHPPAPPVFPPALPGGPDPPDDPGDAPHHDPGFLAGVPNTIRHDRRVRATFIGKILRFVRAYGKTIAGCFALMALARLLLRLVQHALVFPSIKGICRFLLKNSILDFPVPVQEMDMKILKIFRDPKLVNDVLADTLKPPFVASTRWNLWNVFQPFLRFVGIMPPTSIVTDTVAEICVPAVMAPVAKAVGGVFDSIIVGVDYLAYLSALRVCAKYGVMNIAEHFGPDFTHTYVFGPSVPHRTDLDLRADSRALADLRHPEPEIREVTHYRYYDLSDIDRYLKHGVNVFTGYSTTPLQVSLEFLSQIYTPRNVDVRNTVASYEALRNALARDQSVNLNRYLSLYGNDVFTATIQVGYALVCANRDFLAHSGIPSVAGPLNPR